MPIQLLISHHSDNSTNKTTLVTAIKLEKKIESRDASQARRWSINIHTNRQTHKNRDTHNQRNTHNRKSHKNRDTHNRETDTNIEIYTNRNLHTNRETHTNRDTHRLTKKNNCNAAYQGKVRETSTLSAKSRPRAKHGPL